MREFETLKRCRIPPARACCVRGTRNPEASMPLRGRREHIEAWKATAPVPATHARTTCCRRYQSDQSISVGEMVFVQSAVRVTGHVLARCRHGRPASAAAQRTIDARAESTTTSYSYCSSTCLPRKGASVISSRRRRKVRLPASLSAPSSQVRRQPNCTCPRQTSLPRHST